MATRLRAVHLDPREGVGELAGKRFHVASYVPVAISVIGLAPRPEATVTVGT